MCFSTQPHVDPDTDFSKLTTADVKRLNPHRKVGAPNPAFIAAYSAWLRKQRSSGEQLKPQVFPLELMPFIRILNGKEDFQIGKYGLLPTWCKEEKFGRNTYNSRSETIFEKPSFKKAILHQRCVLPTISFFEWSDGQHEPDGKKHLYNISMEDEGPFYIAGLWEHHPKFGLSCSIVTTEPIKQVWDEAHHNRSPMILDSEQVESWLDPAKVDAAQIQPLFKVWNAGKLKIERVK